MSLIITFINSKQMKIFIFLLHSTSQSKPLAALVYVKHFSFLLHILHQISRVLHHIMNPLHFKSEYYQEIKPWKSPEDQTEKRLSFFFHICSFLLGSLSYSYISWNSIHNIKPFRFWDYLWKTWMIFPVTYLEGTNVQLLVFEICLLCSLQLMLKPGSTEQGESQYLYCPHLPYFGSVFEES